LLYGVTGALAETISFGFQNLIGAGLWILVYGLMVYLPAFVVSPMPGTRPPKAQHYVLALVLPLVSAIPVALAILFLFHRPATEFQDALLAIGL
jgi:membrane protein DedA with SNARE-associated domain